ncbi:MAG TPA: peptidylprolyl isomerase [Thermoanaerobaculia bacterium]|nr:peptidylprolyl isomerase [Thermoanaerobaculia bacterium]
MGGTSLKALFCGLLFFALAGCAQNGGDTATTDTTATTASDTAAATDTAPMTSAAPAAEEKPMSAYENKIAELHTTAGQIHIRFFPDVAPNHVRNFIDLSESGYFNDTRFHRVIPGFVIQGGDPNTKTGGNPATWGTGGSGKNVKAEFSTIPHKRGILSMARSGHPDSASSQFFICVADVDSLNNKYTVFGEVTQGMDVVDTIVNAPTRGETPVEPVAITKVVVRDAREDEKKK